MKNSSNIDGQLIVLKEIEEVVSPLLNQLKADSAENLEAIHALQALEANLQKLAEYYGPVSSMGAAYLRLTPSEALVAGLVRQGLSTQAIAAKLNRSSTTVATHRKRIRNKLGLVAKADLLAFLLSLTE